MSHNKSKKQSINLLNFGATNDEMIERINLLIQQMNEINSDYYPYPYPPEIEIENE